jgi:C-terminal processing protease CtpA/Prc
VAVLSNESIFSSTGDFIYGCLENKLAAVVGNMVPLSGFGQSTQIVLPSGKYVMSYCFFESIGPDGSPLENVVLEPDVKISQTYEDYLNHVDTQLEKAFQVIKENNLGY